jgi:hypothetical protein
MTLLEKCNADVYKAILDIKAEHPEIGEKLIDILKTNYSHHDLTLIELLCFSAHLPYGKLWNGKVYSFYLLFQSQQTTKMP